MLEWMKRAKKRTTTTAEVWSYDSRCGEFRIECHKSTLACEQHGAVDAKGKRRKKRKEVWFAYYTQKGIKSGKVFQFVDPNKSRYQTRNAAEKACEEYAKRTP